MKKLALTSLLIAISAVFCQAGPERYSAKEKEVVPPPCEWYRAGEWDFSIWGAYAFAGDDEDDNFAPSNLTIAEYEAYDREYDRTNRPVFLGSAGDDHFLRDGDGWGAGIDVKYFWSRYFGAGLEGFVLDSDNTSGAFLGTLTARYPIGCSRFAPYAFGGFGIFAGEQRNHTDFFFSEHHVAPGVEAGEREFFLTHEKTDRHARAIGQIGGGVEFRVTRPSTASKLAVGLMADITWNFIAGTDDNDDQDFGMARFGFNFSY